MLLLFTIVSLNAQEIFDAATKKDTVAMLKLLNSGTDINALDNYDNSLLLTYARWGDLAIVDYLLRHGATPDSPRSPKGRTALIVACAYYSGKDICEKLLEKGADVNAAAQNGATALMMASQNAKIEVVELLLAHGADAAMKDEEGKTALDYAREANVDEWLTDMMKNMKLDKDKVIAMLEKIK